MISLFQLARSAISLTLTSSRGICTTLPQRIKEIQEKRQGDVLVLQAVNKLSNREDKLLAAACQPKFCPECTLGLNIKHTDVLILSQYLRSDGCMLPRRVTGLCRRQQKRMSSLVTMAQKAGLMPNMAPHWSKRDPKKRYSWKKFNKYYLEQTIRY